MSEFSDRPFVAGSLTGVRAFNVDKLGRLVGVSYPQVFRPGENQATCRVGESFVLTLQTLEQQLFGRAVTPEPTPRPQHRVGRRACSCGFYAYFNGRSEYSEPGRVTALVEGYGVCTVGSRGFRAEKARLVALVLPLGLKQLLLSWKWCAVLAAWSAVFMTLALIDHAWWPAALQGACLVLWSAWGAWRFTRRHKVARPYDAALVRRNYPDVPVYRTLWAAKRAHPLTPPEPPRMPTPADEDFWTRAVPQW